MEEYNETVEFIHQNPVRRGLVKCAEDWPGSSYREYSGQADRPPKLVIDRVRLPADERTRI